ncbi:unnamed protein product [Caenorhabditis nigoni]
MVASSVKLDPIFEDASLLPPLPEDKNPIGHRFESEPTRANALAAAKRLLDDSRGQSWEQLARKYTLGLSAAPCVERLSEEELDESFDTMPEYHNYRFNRSRSVDLSSISR